MWIKYIEETALKENPMNKDLRLMHKCKQNVQSKTQRVLCFVFRLYIDESKSQDFGPSKQYLVLFHILYSIPLYMYTVCNSVYSSHI